ncbi:MAG: hypothetical protein UU09_C0003G0013 [Microgenomates group bacterium GW2011_GWA2_40_6]|nr:MAG: hypothetical protein UU09_C0003G0013 [Microgenomates group bacterium GW2011_GWA2_40_6]
MKIKEFIFLLLMVIPATIALFKPGFYGASDEMHIAWLQQMDQAIVEGQIPPRYVSDLSFGFGYPLFNFISPLPYYVGEIFHLLGLSFVDSIKAIFIVSILGSAVAMYFLVKQMSGGWVGMAAATLYIYSPYRSTDIYNRGALGESLAFVFLPLILYFLLKVKKSVRKYESVRWIGWGAIATAALILTHNIVSYMFIPLVIMLGIILLKNRLKELILFFGLGLLGSFYFWWPALMDSRLMKYDTVFNFFDHFPALKQLLIPYWGYGASVPGNYDTMSFFIGEVNLLIMGMSIVLLIKSFKSKTLKLGIVWWWCLALILLAMVMMNFRSFWIWEHFPLIAYFQFPWRFLTLIVFGSSILVTTITTQKNYKIWSGLIIILAIGFNYYRFKPNDFLNRDDSYYINRYIPIPSPSNEYLDLKEEYLRLPKATEVRPKNIYSRVFPESLETSYIRPINHLDTALTTDSGKSLTLNYNKYYFPGWEAIMDNKKLKLWAGEPYGQIQFDVPDGKHEILIRFRETLVNRIWDIGSMLTIMGCIYLAARRPTKVE